MALIPVVGLGWVAACTDDARLVGHGVPEVTVQVVRDQGLELGAEATPQEVVFVLLRAIRDDVLAGEDQPARRPALERQFAVCDPDYIYDCYRDWFRRVYGRNAVAGRDEWVYKRVSLWAPVLAHYVASFDFDLQEARSQMRVLPTSPGERWPGETCQVDIPVADPAGRQGADVVARVRLHRHSRGYWRVFQVGFAKQRAGVASAAGTTAAKAKPGQASSP